MKFTRASQGQSNDITQAVPLLKGVKAEHVIADKGYDGRRAIEFVEGKGAQVLIPLRKNHKAPRAYEKSLYRERNQIERLFGKLKQCRRLATRCDRTARNIMASLHLAASAILMA